MDEDVEMISNNKTYQRLAVKLFLSNQLLVTVMSQFSQQRPKLIRDPRLLDRPRQSQGDIRPAELSTWCASVTISFCDPQNPRTIIDGFSVTWKFVIPLSRLTNEDRKILTKSVIIGIDHSLENLLRLLSPFRRTESDQLASPPLLQYRNEYIDATSVFKIVVLGNPLEDFVV